MIFQILISAETVGIDGIINIPACYVYHPQITKENIFVESVIYDGENLIYKNKGHNAVIKVTYSGLNKDGMLEYTIELATGAREKVPREYLSLPENPDVASLPTTLPEVQEAAKQLSD